MRRILTNNTVQTKVSELLNHANITSDPVDLMKIAEFLKIQVKYHALPDEVSGALDLRDLSNALILVNSGHSTSRQRFTLAHEIGHFCLQHVATGIHIDNKILFRKNKTDKEDTKKEREANRFAAELLMPEHWLKKNLFINGSLNLDYWNKDDGIELLAQKYDVSTSAMAIRLDELKLIPRI